MHTHSRNHCSAALLGQPEKVIDTCRSTLYITEYSCRAAAGPNGAGRFAGEVGSLVKKEMGMRFERLLAELSHRDVHVSRRDLLKYSGLGGLAVAATGLLAACGDDDDEPDAPAQPGTTPAPADDDDDDDEDEDDGETPEPDDDEDEDDEETPDEPDDAREGGVWRMALHANPSTNVVTAPGALADILTFKTMYNNLVKYQLADDAIELVPDLCESWEVSEDVTELTFQLRDNVVWHDGEPFVADDVVFTFEVVLDPDNAASGRANFTSIGEVEAIDDHTVVMHLPEPDAALPIKLGYNRPIYPKHALEGQNYTEPVDFMRDPIGTGPFKFKEQVQGSHLELERNDDYFHGRPHLDGIIFAVVPDGNTRVAQLLSGDVDFAVIEPAQIDAVQGNPNIEVRLAPQVNYYFFAFNHSREIVQDPLVRQALSYAIDKQLVIDSFLAGAGTVATGPINPFLGDYYNADVQQYPLDMERAEELLAEAGWTRGDDGFLVNDAGERFHIVFNGPSNYPIMVQVMTYAEQQFSALGIEVEMEIVDWPVHLDAYRGGEYDILMNWWITPPDPDQYTHYHSEVGNWWNYGNPEVDELLIQGRSVAPREDRVPIYHDFQEVVAEDLPVMYLYYPQEVQAVSARTKGFVEMGYRDALTWMEQVYLED
jgi:peptide/nickel transport system substrate-binding protein